MAVLNFDIKTVTLPNGEEAKAVFLTGSIDASTNQAFEGRLSDILSSGTHNVLLVLTNVKYINSTGLGTIVKCVDTFRESGGDIKLVGVPTKVIALFEMLGLLALFELTAARFPARTGPDGEAVLLEDQDRRGWDRSAIRRGLAAIGRASALGRGLGPYGLQAAIAACHASASSVQDTDWERVVLLYEALGRVAPSPVVELNRAVAVAMANGPQQALSIVDELVASDRLSGSYLLPSVRGELLARLGLTAEARAELELAARLCSNVRERSVLLRKAAALA